MRGSLVAGCFALGVALAMPQVARAQAAEPAPVMKKLSAMAGEWHGTAVITVGPQGSANAISWEKVESKLGGLALFVHGRHVDAADTTKVVHEAVGMLFYDGTTQKLKFIPMIMNGLTVETWANETEKGMDWGFAIPGGVGHVRYQVDLSTPDVWIETGQFSRDGTNWMPTIRMELKRAK